MKNYDELLSEFPDPEHTDFTKMGSGYLIINVLSRVAQCLTEETDEEFDDNDIAIAATESDDIIRGIDQQIKRNAKSR